uniref:Uncharacterized protein n=1 Tax=Populus trichocarpa TaxID=3694 RepID=U5FLD8_POPTR
MGNNTGNWQKGGDNTRSSQECISAGMITLVCPCTRNSYKRFEGAREEDCRTIAGVAAVRAPPAWGSTTGTPGQAGSRPARTPAQKSHNSRPDHRIAPRFLLELPESISLIVAMESLHAPPLGGQGTPCGKGKCISASMIAPVSPCRHNSNKRFEGAREEDHRAIAGVTAVRAPSAREVRLGPRGRPMFPRASRVRFPYNSNGIATQTAGSFDLDVLSPEPWAFHSFALSLAPIGRITALLLSAGRGCRTGKERRNSNKRFEGACEEDRTTIPGIAAVRAPSAREARLGPRGRPANHRTPPLDRQGKPCEKGKSSDAIRCISVGMIAPVCPCTRNSYKRFEGAREEDRRAMAGVMAVRSSPVRGSDWYLKVHFYQGFISSFCT